LLKQQNTESTINAWYNTGGGNASRPAVLVTKALRKQTGVSRDDCKTLGKNRGKGKQKRQKKGGVLG